MAVCLRSLFGSAPFVALFFLPPTGMLGASRRYQRCLSAVGLIDLLPSALETGTLQLMCIVVCVPWVKHGVTRKGVSLPMPSDARSVRHCTVTEMFALGAAFTCGVILLLNHCVVKCSGVAPVYRGICFLSFSLEETCYAVGNKTKNKDQSQWKCCNVSRQKH